MPRLSPISLLRTRLPYQTSVATKRPTQSISPLGIFLKDCVVRSLNGRWYLLDIYQYLSWTARQTTRRGVRPSATCFTGAWNYYFPPWWRRVNPEWKCPGPMVEYTAYTLSWLYILPTIQNSARLPVQNRCIAHHVQFHWIYKEISITHLCNQGNILNAMAKHEAKDQHSTRN